MKLKIVGSGGIFQIPNPFCKCGLCEEAREKGGRFRRLGPSLYIEDIAMLIDTPEDIAVACERQGVSQIRWLSISHKDPDHTRGMRIVEPLGYNAITGESTPVQFVALPEVVEDINQWNFNSLEYYEKVLRCIEVTATDQIEIDGISVRLCNNLTPKGNMTFYVLEQNGKKAVYAPCDVKPFQPNEHYRDADVFIVGLVSHDGILKGGSRLEDAPFRDEMFSLEEIYEIKREYNIGEIIVTHIDEYWARSYEEYCRAEKELDGIRFAYDGMKIVL